MAAVIYDTLDIVQGEDFASPVYTYVDDLAMPVDLTGASAFAEFREHDVEPRSRLTLSSSASEIVLGGAAGTIQLKIPRAKTRLMTFLFAGGEVSLTTSLGLVVVFAVLRLRVTRGAP